MRSSTTLSTSKHELGWFWFLGLPIIVLLAHIIIWMAVAMHTGQDLNSILSHWDSGWYNKIILEGYYGKARAFPLLYPLSVKLFSSWLPWSPQWVGAVFSTLLFFVACLVFRFLYQQGSRDLRGLLTPGSREGWLLFILSPASYVFHSHHTESLFLILSLTALYSAQKGASRWAAVLAGLSALTRVQGVFIAVTVAFWGASQRRDWPARVRFFVWSGLISGGIFLVYPAYLAYLDGDWLAYWHSNIEWDHPTMTLPIAIKAFFLANPWQSLELGSLLHHGFAAALFWATWLLYKRSKPLTLLMVLNLVVFPLQGEFVDAFRFGAVLFPALFCLGDWLHKQPRFFRYAAIFGAALLNMAVCYGYAISKWAY